MTDPIFSDVRISHPDRVIFPDCGVTKGDLAEYYNALSEAIVAEGADRPLSLLRLPDGMKGERFFQRHPGPGFPKSMHEIQLREASGKVDDYIYARSIEGFLAAVQFGTVEFHIWGAHVDRIERPDRMVFDLDPDEALPFTTVIDAALRLRGVLEELGLSTQPMLSGGKGIHLTLALRRTVSWDSVSDFAKGVASLLALKAPDRYTTEISKAKRKGRIFIDWLRNDRSATAVMPFSVRARPGAPIAAPVTWDELRGFSAANAIGIPEALERYRKGHAQPPAQTLSKTIISALDERLNAVARA